MKRFLPFSSNPIRSARAPPTLAQASRLSEKKSQTALSDLRNVGYTNPTFDTGPAF